MGVYFAMAFMLGPADFGTMAILLAWISVGTFLVDAGFGAALVQRDQLTEKHLTSAFASNVVIAIISFIAMWTLAPFISRAYAEPVMVDVLRVLALAILLSSAVSTKVSLAQREMRFKQLAIRDSSAVVIGGVAGITCALAGWGIWSLVVQTLSGAAISAVMTWQIVPWAPHRRDLSLKAVRDLSGYSGRMLLFGLLKIAAQNVDVMLIGYTMNVAMAGLYSLAFKMIITPTGAIRAAFGAYFFPAFSRLQDNRDILAIEYERALKLVGYGCIPFLLIFYFAVDQFVAYALPEKWIDAVPVAKVLTFVALNQLFIAIFGELIKAVGRPGLLIWWSVGLLVSTAAAL
jgi:PST family polysaccharide transporter